MARAPKWLWYGILATNLAIILIYWWQGSGGLVTQGTASAAIALGRLSGLSALAAVLLQFVFMGRTPWVERTFGLDKLARIHHVNGQLAGIFLLLHPLLLTFGYSRLAGVGLLPQLADFLLNYHYVLWAGIGWLLFLVVIPSSIAIVRRRLRYESWYFVHLLVYGAVFASLWHPLFVGTDLIASRLFYSYWLVLYSVVFGLHVVFRWLRPLYRNFRHRFVVTRVERENQAAVSVYISGRDLDRFPVQPGQFMIFRFLTAGRWWQAHPFSLSMLPPPAGGGQQLRITVKELGDFTNQVSRIPVGTKVFIDGPYGIFTEWVQRAPKVLFIAGGIGITPIRSLMEQLLTHGKEAILLYANKTKADIVFADELRGLEKKYTGRVVDVLSDDPEFSGEKGFIDAEKIQRLVPDFKTRDIYLCGPPPMMKAILTMLQKLGVPSAQIHWERFAL